MEIPQTCREALQLVTALRELNGGAPDGEDLVNVVCSQITDWPCLAHTLAELLSFVFDNWAEDVNVSSHELYTEFCSFVSQAVVV
jgi:hypothetical protein